MNEPFSAFSGPGTMFGGRPPVYRPDLDVAGTLGIGGPQGMLMNMALQPLVGAAVGPGYVPGQFNPSVNFYDQYRARTMIAQQQAAMRAASRVDRTSYYEMMRGVSALSGTQFGVREARAAEAMAADISAVAPYIAPLMPDLFDKLHGTRGSAVLMAQMVSGAGRYGMDPVTGMRGMSAASVDSLTSGLYDRLYGTGANVGDMRGIGAGRAGQLYEEMQRRGLMGGGSRDELMRSVSASSGLAMDQLGKLPDLDSKLRTADIDRAKDRLKSMAGAVSAMQDLFGEMGEPDAPLPKLLNAIEALTQGGLSNMRPERVEQMVRQASNVARSAGASLESLFQLSANMTGRTDALGLDRTFATKSAVGGVAFADAFGRSMGGLRGFGMMNKDQMAVLGAQLEANAAASPAANRMAAVVRLGEEFGSFDTAGNSDASRLFRALKSGQDTFVDSAGKTRSVAMPASGPGGLQELLTKSGVRGDLYERVLAQTGANQAVLAGNEQMVRAVRRGQGVLDVQPRLAQQFGLAFGTMGGDAATKKALQVAAAEVSGLMLDMDREQFQQFNDGNYSALTDKAEQSLRRQGVNVDPAMRKRLEQEVKLAVGSANEAVKLDPGTRGYKTLGNMLAAHNRRTLREAEYGVREAEVEAQMQSSFSRLGRSGPVQRMADLLRESGPGTTVQDVIAKAFGYQPTEEVQKALEGPLGKVKADMDALAKADPTKDKQRVGVLMAQMAAGGPAAAQAAAELKNLTDFYGVSATDIQKMDSRDLQLSAKSRAARAVEGNMASLQAAMAKAGMVNTKLGSREANDTLRLLSLGHKSAAAKAVALAETTLMDEGAMKALGEDGLDTVMSLRAAGQGLQAKANQLTGGDVSKLLKGEYQGTPEQKAEVDRLRKQADAATSKIGAGLGAGKDQSGGWSDAYKTRLSQHRDDLKKSSQQALTELIATTGRADVIDKTKLQAIAESAKGSDVLQNALLQAKELKAQADKSGGGMAEYTKLLRDRGGIMSVLADAAEGKAVPAELLADEVDKAMKKDAAAQKPTTVAFAPGSTMNATGTLDIVSNQVNLKLTAPPS